MGELNFDQGNLLHLTTCGELSFNLINFPVIDLGSGPM